MAGGRRAAILVLLCLVAAGLLLASLPGDVAAVRLAGVGLLWWYGGVAAPVVAAVVAAVALARSS